MRLELFNLGIESVALWGKSEISNSKMHPIVKLGAHIAVDIGKNVLSNISRQIESQKFRQNLNNVIVFAKVCDIDRLELIQSSGCRENSLFLAFGGDYKLFFQCLNLTYVPLKDEPILAQKIGEMRKQSSIVIYQRQ